MKGGGCERGKFGGGVLGAGADGAHFSCRWSWTVGTYPAGGIGAIGAVRGAREVAGDGGVSGGGFAPILVAQRL